MLGRILPEFFPAIFGKTEDQPLDGDAALHALELIADEVNKQAKKLSQPWKSIDQVYGCLFLLIGMSACFSIMSSREGRRPWPTHDEATHLQVAMGFIKVANETMCRPIRALTQMRGYDVSQHVLSCFGGAGGQHACAIARSLGMRTIFVHRFSGVLSAVGIGLAEVVAEEQVRPHPRIILRH